ncbi:MAG: hypothetical protein Q4C18_01965 [Eubacteriales bacterium]|nr:hypothetical protein [Eubacteriales bacterium]
MDRVRMSLILVATLTLFTCTACAESSYEVNSLSGLKKEIKEAYRDGKMSESEKKTITSDTNPAVLTEFFEEKMEQADEAIADADIDVDEVLNQDEDGEKGKVELNLGDHSKVIVEFEDKEDETLADSVADTLIPSCYAATNGETMWKKYGNRYFTAKKAVLSGIGGASIKLENHYKVSSNGLDERYGDPYVSFNFSAGITGNITAGSPIISDKTARTPGKSDINMYARFPYQYTANVGGVGATTGGTFKLSTTVKYVAKNASEKKIKVKHSWSVSG